MDLNSPAVNVDINRDQAAAQGVSVQSIETALGASFGGEQISTLYASDAEYWVMLELEPQYQNDSSAINLLYVASSNTAGGATTATGAPSTGGGAPSTVTNPTNAPGAPVPPIVPLNAVTTLRMGTMPLSINHLSQLPSVTISFNLLPGYALSDAVTAIEQARTEADIPATLQGQFQGTAQAFQSSLSNMGILLTIAIMTVYIILGILYESFVHPLTILSGLPSAAVGALITLALFGVPLSLYAFVGMIMLIGIVKKNAIMMIDFALSRERGRTCQSGSGDRRSGAGALPPHHDDHHGGAAGHVAGRHRLRRRFGSAPAAGPGGGGRAYGLPAADALHHARDLCVSRPDGREGQPLGLAGRRKNRSGAGACRIAVSSPARRWPRPKGARTPSSGCCRSSAPPPRCRADSPRR